MLITNNPFEQQSTYDFDDYKSQPFISEGFNTPHILAKKLTWNATADGSSRVLIKIISTKGAGKSTLSFFLQDNLMKLNNENIITFYMNDPEITLYNLLRRIMSDNKFNMTFSENEKNIETNFKRFIEGKRLYLFIDFQDILTSTHFKNIAVVLEKLGYLSRNISIILTMNKIHAVKMENYSYVLGKYTPFELPVFTLDNTKELIKARLKLARPEGYNGNEIAPFENVTELIYNQTGGIPRNIISACDLLLSNYEEEIDAESATLLLKGEFAKKVIFDMTGEGFERDYLIQLYDIIRLKFHGEVSKEKDLHDYLETNFRWSSKTSRKRIRKLSGYGLITINKGEDLWSNIIRII